MTVVCNTSPLLFLAKIQRLGLLPRLYSTIRIPAAVLDAFNVNPDQEAMQIQELVDVGTFALQHMTAQILADVPATLSRGEREAIALALETAADLAILDDQEGRRYAPSRSTCALRGYGLPRPGTSASVKTRPQRWGCKTARIPDTAHRRHPMTICHYGRARKEEVHAIHLYLLPTKPSRGHPI